MKKKKHWFQVMWKQTCGCEVPAETEAEAIKIVEQEDPPYSYFQRYDFEVTKEDEFKDGEKVREE